MSMKQAHDELERARANYLAQLGELNHIDEKFDNVHAYIEPSDAVGVAEEFNQAAAGLSFAAGELIEKARAYSMYKSIGGLNRLKLNAGLQSPFCPNPNDPAIDAALNI